jgi:mono/diheme cytochrome c family protein
MRALIWMCLFWTTAVAACDSKAAVEKDATTTGTSSSPEQDAVAFARAQYDPTVFDTIRFASDSLRLARGADVFRWACASCHDAGGKGDGGAVINGDTVHPPSLVEAGWRFAHDENGLRRQIFVGNARGMPHWGLRRTEARDILAVEKYILEALRKSQ